VFPHPKFLNVGDGVLTNYSTRSFEIKLPKAMMDVIADVWPTTG
jgi:hypothetical protein